MILLLFVVDVVDIVVDMVVVVDLVAEIVDFVVVVVVHSVGFLLLICFGFASDFFRDCC